MSKSINFKRITLSDIVTSALSDDRSNNAAKWLQNAKGKVLNQGVYPSREELDDWQLTEMSFLSLSELVYLIPGGGANPLSKEIVEYQLKQLRQRNAIGDREVMILLGTHGTYFSPEESLESTRLSKEQVEFLNTIPRKYHVQSLFAEASCGLSRGATSYLRNIFNSTIKEMDALKKEYLPFTVQPLEALVGQIVKRKSKLYNMRGEIIYELDVNDFNLHDKTNIGFFFQQSGEPSSISLVKPTEERLLNSQELNAQLREYIDRGITIMGIMCLDDRMGVTLPHPNIKNMPIDYLVTSLNINKGFLRGDYSSKWQNTRHTELPFGVFLTGENDLRPTMFAYYLITNRLSLVQEGIGRIAPSRPIIVSFPAELLNESSVGNVLSGQLYGLLSNMVHEIYQKNRVFGVDFGGRATNVFILDNEKLKQIEYDDGLHIMFPNTETGHNLAEFEIRHPLITKQKNGYVNPNPPALLYAPWSRQKIGCVIDRYVKS